jgi:hypothetical protein
MSNRNSLILKVEGFIGSDIDDCILDAIRIAQILQVGVEFDFNGGKVFAWPHSTKEEAKRFFHCSLERLKEKG